MNKWLAENQKEANKIIRDFLLHKEETTKSLAPEIFFIISEIRKNIFQKDFDTLLPEIEKFFLQMSLKLDKGCSFFVAAARLANFFLQDQWYLSWKKSSDEDKKFANVLAKYQKKSDPWHIQNSQLLILSDVVSGFIYDIIMSSTLADKEKIAVCEQIAVFLETNHLRKIEKLIHSKI